MPDSLKTNKKSLLLSLLFLVGAVLLFAAGLFIFNHAQDYAAPYTPDQITSKIIGDTKATDLAKVDSSLVSKHYDIPSGTVVSSSLYMSKSSDSATELNCFLLTDTSKYDKLRDAVNAHINTKAAGLKSLNPTQYALLKNYLIVRRGRYVLVAVGQNVDAENKAFQSIFE
jgi:hypothetical protein